MRSAVQSELKLTCKFVCFACRSQSATRTSRGDRKFHSASVAQARQSPRNTTRFPIKATANYNKNDAHFRPENGVIVEKETKNPLLVSQQTENTGGPSSEDPDNNIVAEFYGSASKRRGRSRAQRDSASPQPIPQWIVDGNIHLLGYGHLSLDTPSQIERVFFHEQSGEYRTAPAISTDLDVPKDKDLETPSNGLGSGLNLLRNGKDAQDSVDTEKQGSSETTTNLAPESSRYSIVSAQHDEIRRTLKGLMQLSQSNDGESEPGVLKTHLLLHYSGRDGDVFLDHLVSDLAKENSCDMLSLDVQDIADLISMASTTPTTISEGRMLSYELYNDLYGDGHEDEDALAEEEDEEEEDDDMDVPDSNFPPGRGFPPGMIIGKPIRIDLKDMLNAQTVSGNGIGSISRQLFPDAFQRTSSKAQPQPFFFDTLADGLISALMRERESKTQTSPSNPVKGHLIHIKNLKAIQDSPIGLQFLGAMYRQVDRRRALKQSLVLIGTESSKEGKSQYEADRIDELQKDRPNEISRTIVITPAFRNRDAEANMLSDRKIRIATVNARHVWENMRFKYPHLTANFEAGFWHKDFLPQLHKDDIEVLKQEIWDFGMVHRVTTYLAGKFELNSATKAGVTWDSGKYPILYSAVRDLTESDESKKRWARATKVDSQEKESKPKDKTHESRLNKIKETATKYEKRLLGGVIEPGKLTTTFKDVHVPVQTIDALQTLTTLSLVRPEAFTYGVLASDRIPGLLMYGPPGTGKTLLAKAVAKESGATVLEVSGADINDMYVGEGEKNVKALFSLAKNLSPCIVFLDEADAMFSSRATQGRRASHRELLNQFLKEWDGMSNDSGSAFIMVATNRPMDLDDAVLRRLPRRLLIDLPSEADRLEILKIHLKNELLADDVNLTQIAKNTPFYSGSDLKNLSVAAALSCVREENELAKKHNEAIATASASTSSSPSLSTSDSTSTSLESKPEPYRHVEKRILRATHFDNALEEISASISEDMSSLRDIKKFDEQFGDKRGKRKRQMPKWGFKSAEEANKVLDTVKVRDV